MKISIVAGVGFEKIEQFTYSIQESVLIFGRDACQHPQQERGRVHFQFDSTSWFVLWINMDWSIVGKLWRLRMG